MSDKKIMIGDSLIEAKLLKTCGELDISLDELIDRYIRRGLYCDDYYDPPELTLSEIKEISRKEMEKDRKRGIKPKKHNFGVFIGRLNKEDD